MASVNRGARLRKIPIETYNDIFAAKILLKTEVSENGCWEWKAYKNSTGYGSIRYLGINSLAHRVSYILFVGNIENGKDICHKCDNPGCINPSHLFSATHHENMMDAKIKNRRKGRLTYNQNVNRDVNGRFLKEVCNGIS